MAAAATIAKPHRNIAADLRQILNELSAHFFERTEILEALMVTLLARQHGFLLGPPGVGKSNLIEDLCGRFIGAKYWRILMDRQLGKEESFGPIDIAVYEKTGHWGRDITDTLADCHLAFIDEAGKAGPASLNPYLTVMQERKFKPNGGWIKVPLISAFAASNETLEDELGAMWDRFLVRLMVEDIVEPANFAGLLQSAIKTPGAAPAPFTTVDLADLQHATTVDVPAITLPSGVTDSMLQLRQDLRSAGIHPSGRRWKQSIGLLQASAYLNGRSVIDDDDLAILRHVLWDVAPQIGDVEKKVLGLTSPVTRQAIELAGQIEDIEGHIASMKGQSDEARSSYGGEAQFKLKEIGTKVSTIRTDAIDQGRSTARLDSVTDRLHAAYITMLTECLNMPENRARRMADAALS